MSQTILQIEPWIDNAELEELKKVIDSTFITEAGATKEFEERTKELTGSRHAISMTNGTAALFCCLRAIGVVPGDEVIVPDLTFIATANAVILAGATPVFADITPDTFCIDLKSCEKLLTKKTKAIIPVHIYGQSVDMQELMAFAERHKLVVVEDAAQGVGVRFNGKHVGTFGALGILSYYGNKTITCGEGGIVLTNNDHLAKEIYRLKNHGRDRKGIFIHDTVGFNFSFTEMQAAVGNAQMKKLPAIIAKKQAIYDRYTAELHGVNGLTPVVIDPRSSPVFWFTSFLCDHVDGLSTHLAKQGIQTRRFFYPLHMQPCYQKNVARWENCPVTEDIYNRGLSLPSSYSLTEDQQSRVIEAIVDHLGR